MVVPLLLASFLLAPTSGDDLSTAQRQALLSELNQIRQQAGLEALSLHPALCTIAQEQVNSVARSGATGSNPEIIPQTTRRLYREGYAAHRWSEGTLIAVGEENLLEQWREVAPDFYKKATAGDFEDIGIAFSRFRGRPAVSMVVALKTRTAEWRQAAPLADLAEVRWVQLAAVNTERKKKGLPPVQSESRLDAAAQNHAEDMLRRSYYAHVSPEGETPGQRARAAGYPRARSVSENIAKGPFSPDEVVQRWMNSSGHRRNILRRKATEIGIGVAFGENENGFETVWVQIFASR